MLCSGSRSSNLKPQIGARVHVLCGAAQLRRHTSAVDGLRQQRYLTWASQPCGRPAMPCCPTGLPVHLPLHMSSFPAACSSTVHLSIHDCPSVCLTVHPTEHFSTHLSEWPLPIYLPACLFLCVCLLARLSLHAFGPVPWVNSECHRHPRMRDIRPQAPFFTPALLPCASTHSAPSVASFPSTGQWQGALTGPDSKRVTPKREGASGNRAADIPQGPGSSTTQARLCLPFPHRLLF